MALSLSSFGSFQVSTFFPVLASNREMLSRSLEPSQRPSGDGVRVTPPFRAIWQTRVCVVMSQKQTCSPPFQGPEVAVELTGSTDPSADRAAGENRFPGRGKTCRTLQDGTSHRARKC